MRGFLEAPGTVAITRTSTLLILQPATEVLLHRTAPPLPITTTYHPPTTVFIPSHHNTEKPTTTITLNTATIALNTATITLNTTTITLTQPSLP